MFNTGNHIVNEMQGVNITGNVVPVQWFKTVVRANKKPNLNAIMILSDIVYWYKPRTIRDEATGGIIGMEKRFKADLLQRSYQQIADQFGISKREATNAVVELEKLGVIKRHLRTIQASGVRLTNVLYIELVPSVLKALTTVSQVAVSESDTSHFEKGDPLTLESDTLNFEKSYPLTLKSDTYTESTTKTTTKITTGNKEKEPTLAEVDSTKNRNIKVVKDSIPQKAKKVNTFAEFAGQDTELLEALTDFEDMRKAIKSPMTEKAKQLLVSKLAKEFPNRTEQIATLNQSIECNYKTVYPLKGSWQKAKEPKQPNYDWGVEGVDYL